MNTSFVKWVVGDRWHSKELCEQYGNAKTTRWGQKEAPVPVVDLEDFDRVMKVALEMAELIRETYEKDPSSISLDKMVSAAVFMSGPTAIDYRHRMYVEQKRKKAYGEIVELKLCSVCKEEKKLPDGMCLNCGWEEKNRGV